MKVLPSLPEPFRDATVRLMLTVLGLAILAGFALGGAGGLPGLVSLGMLGAWIAVLLPRPSAYVFWPALGLTLLLPQIAPAIYVFDGVFLLVGLAALVWTLNRSDERVWEIHRAGWFAIATIVIPLLAIPTAVVSMKSFIAQYKNFLGYVVMFLSLRRLVRREDSHSLLWFAPIVGTIASLQLLHKTAGVSAVNMLRIELRNFHTALGWGQSNYVAAVLVLCLGISALLMVVDRRPAVRMVLVGACLIMMRSFIFLYSRTATIAMLVFLLVVILARGGRAALLAVGAGALVVLSFILTPYGAVLLRRFTDPTEYASTQVRLLIWQTAWLRFTDNPWTGIGLNQGRAQRDLMDAGHAHNTLLDYLSEQGVFGGSLYVVLLLALLVLCTRVTPIGAPASAKTARILCVATLAAVFVSSLAEPMWHGYVHAMVFVYFAAWMTMQTGGSGAGRT